MTGYSTIIPHVFSILQALLSKFFGVFFSVKNILRLLVVKGLTVFTYSLKFAFINSVKWLNQLILSYVSVFVLGRAL